MGYHEWIIVLLALIVVFLIIARVRKRRLERKFVSIFRVSPQSSNAGAVVRRKILELVDAERELSVPSDEWEEAHSRWSEAADVALKLGFHIYPGT